MFETKYVEPFYTLLAAAGYLELLAIVIYGCITIIREEWVDPGHVKLQMATASFVQNFVFDVPQTTPDKHRDRLGIVPRATPVVR